REFRHKVFPVMIATNSKHWIVTLKLLFSGKIRRSMLLLPQLKWHAVVWGMPASLSVLSCFPGPPGWEKLKLRVSSPIHWAFRSIDLTCPNIWNAMLFQD